MLPSVYPRSRNEERPFLAETPFDNTMIFVVTFSYVLTVRVPQVVDGRSAEKTPEAADVNWRDRIGPDATDITR